MPDVNDSRNDEFREELRALLNRHCRENESNTPDFILGEYLRDCLAAFDRATKARTEWWGCKCGFHAELSDDEARSGISGCGNS